MKPARERATPTNFSLVNFINRLLGILPPFTDQLDQAKLWSAYSLVITVTLGSLCYSWKVYYEFFNQSLTNTLVNKLLSLTKITLLAACTAVHVCCTCMTKYGYWNIILKEALFHKIWYNKRSRDSRYKTFWTPVGIIWIIYFYPGHNKLYFNGNFSALAKQFSMWYYETTMLLICMQFCTALHSIAKQLSQLRMTLLVCNTAKLVAAVHRRDELIRVAILVNRLYSMQLLLSCGHVMFSTVSFLYHVIGHIATSRAKFPKEVILTVNVGWQLSKLYCVSEACQLVNDQVEAFNADYFRLLRNHTTLMNKENYLTCCMAKSNIQFTTFGFFDLGFPLVTSVITASATYLIILVQFNL